MSDHYNCFDFRRLSHPLHQKALRVCFLRNGDRHFNGVNMVISRAHFKDFHALLQGVTESLGRHVVLRSAIAHFCRTDGSHLTSLSSFRETDIVICCCKNEEMVWVKYSVNKDFLRMVESCKRWRQRRLYSGCLDRIKPYDLPEAIQLYIESLETVVQNPNTLIYRGQSKASRTKCIVKMVNKQRRSNNYVEAEVLRQLQSHPNIVELMYTVEEERYMYLVLEHLDCDMQDVIQELGIMSEKSARLVMRCTVAALAHMHQLQVIHRDIKPENLLVYFSSGGWNFEMVKVADFGLATYYRDKLYVFCGSPCYMAPEIIAMSGYDYQVDSWSLGVTLFYMLCGQRPFASASQDVNEIYAAIMSGGPSYPKDMDGVLSPGASQLIDGLLVRNPSNRSTIAELGQYPFLAL
ncbi:serine/threonine-protein kinase GD17699 [Drosophila erecta]|uniref:Doublecortin-like and CAM kinase-like protein n=1 Tax=Drosophila erecta TaxID=7220 RepID=B3P7B5_DROER|nr:serine/threonine-protein kinase GD17699 [Drosophila erecta]EDV54004.1 uncharacterized protein Dere_GG12430 [Drosophila erecta]